MTNAHERCPCGVPNDIGSWLIAAGTRWHAGCYEAALRFAQQHPGYWKARRVHGRGQGHVFLLRSRRQAPAGRVPHRSPALATSPQMV